MTQGFVQQAERERERDSTTAIDPKFLCTCKCNIWQSEQPRGLG